jgi:hypothetical protein
MAKKNKKNDNIDIKQIIKMQSMILSELPCIHSEGLSAIKNMQTCLFRDFAIQQNNLLSGLSDSINNSLKLNLTSFSEINSIILNAEANKSLISSLIQPLQLSESLLQSIKSNTAINTNIYESAFSTLNSLDFRKNLLNSLPNYSKLVSDMIIETTNIRNCASFEYFSFYSTRFDPALNNFKNNEDKLIAEKLSVNLQKYDEILDQKVIEIKEEIPEINITNISFDIILNLIKQDLENNSYTDYWENHKDKKPKNNMNIEKNFQKNITRVLQIARLVYKSVCGKVKIDFVRESQIWERGFLDFTLILTDPYQKMAVEVKPIFKSNELNSTGKSQLIDYMNKDPLFTEGCRLVLNGTNKQFENSIELFGKHKITNFYI